MRARPFPRSWPVAGLIVFTGACSIITDLSELERGTTSVGGAGGATTSSVFASSTSSTSGTSGGDCSGAQEFRDPATSHCYFYDVTGTDDRFSDARAKCKAWDPSADLVVIETAAEASFLLGQVNLQKDTWIGLSELTSPGTYEWVTGAPLMYTAWDSGFPNDAMGQSQCVHYAFTLKWQNAPCSSTNLTLCERP